MVSNLKYIIWIYFSCFILNTTFLKSLNTYDLTLLAHHSISGWEVLGCWVHDSRGYLLLRQRFLNIYNIFNRVIIIIQLAVFVTRDLSTHKGSPGAAVWQPHRTHTPTHKPEAAKQALNTHNEKPETMDQKYGRIPIFRLL